MMISLVNIRDSMASRLKSGFADWKVHFDNVERPHAPYFYVELSPRAKSLDDVYSERRIAVNIAAILPQNRAGRVSRKDLFDVADKLDSLIRPVFKVEDRVITITEANTVIVDDILHYYFELNFADAVEKDDGELAMELELNLMMKGMSANGK